MSKHLQSFSFFTVVFFLFITATTLHALKANAEDYGWTDYKTPNGVFQVTIPDNAETKISFLRLDPKRKLYSEELIASAKQEIFKKGAKNYIVKFDQTIGKPMEIPERKALLNQEIKSYLSFYNKIGAKLEKVDNIQTHRDIGQEIYLTYDDKETGKQAVRVKVLFSPETRFQQVMTGPDTVAEATISKRFFQSLEFTPGYALEKGSFESEWTKYTSPLKIFSVLLPPKMSPYIPRDPIFSNDKNTERMTFIFKDPVRSQQIFYNVYAYCKDENFTFAEAEELLLNKHILKHRRDISDISIQRIKGANPGLLTTYAMPRHKKFPFIERAELRVMFAKNYLLVQELITSKLLMDTSLVKNTLRQIEFHPEEAHADYLKAQSKEETKQSDNGEN